MAIFLGGIVWGIYGTIYNLVGCFDIRDAKLDKLASFNIGIISYEP